jgi:hypothetical protein
MSERTSGEGNTGAPRVEENEVRSGDGHRNQERVSGQGMSYKLSHGYGRTSSRSSSRTRNSRASSKAILPRARMAMARSSKPAACGASTRVPAAGFRGSDSQSRQQVRQESSARGCPIDALAHPEEEQRTMSQTATRTAARGAWPVERFETPQQCAGYRVRDPLGRKIGRLKRLFLNESGGPEYAEVKLGLLGLKTVLIPLQTVTADAERRFLVLE